MKRNLLARLRTNGILYVMSAVLLVVGVPLYQTFVLAPARFGDALNGGGANTFVTYMVWIGGHSGVFLGYRILLVLAFALILTLPFSLYRIIVAQEILGQQDANNKEVMVTEEVEEGEKGEERQVEGEKGEEGVDVQERLPATTATTRNDGMPAFAWRGKGFVVLATWLATAGLLLYVLGTIISTVYLLIVSGNATAGTGVLEGAGGLEGVLTIMTNMVGIGLLGLGMLFFGAMISRTGLNLWPGIWLALGYVAILVGALLCIGAIAAGAAAGGGQGILNTAATFLFALWTLCFGVMLMRLRAE